MTAAEGLAWAGAFLARRRVPEPEASAEFILAEVLRRGRMAVRVDGERPLAPAEARRLRSLVLKRARRVPLAYVLGSQPFLGLDIKTTSGALIPRPETEELAAEAVKLFKSDGPRRLDILDIGTGSGCLALALGAEFPGSCVLGTDSSPAALRLARRNARSHGLQGRVRFEREDLFRPRRTRRGRADLVVSNPPYIPSSQIARLSPEVRREPRLALDGGPDGLCALRAVIAQAPGRLKRGGWLVLEVGDGQAGAVRRLLEEAGLAGVSLKKDMQGKERIVTAQYGPSDN